MPVSSMLDPKFLTEGAFVNYPKAIMRPENMIVCPCCGWEWQKFGSGYGFVKHGASTHIASCYEKLLAQNGLQMKQPYNQAKLGWELVKIETQTDVKKRRRRTPIS
jgi:hypothetical protein